MTPAHLKISALRIFMKGRNLSKENNLQKKNSSSSKIFIAHLFLFFSLGSCATVSYQEADVALRVGDFSTAYSHIAAQEKKGYKKKDLLLYYLDAGMLAHYKQDYALSSRLLEAGERGFAAAQTKSISRELGSFMVNDNVKEYGGEDYENLYINIFNSFNYYHRGLADDAMVEIRRMENKLKSLTLKYSEEFANNKKKLAEQQSLNSQLTEDYSNSAYMQTSSFSNSALAQYMGMLYYRMQHKYDDMRISYQNLKLAFAAQKHLYNFPIPDSVRQENKLDSSKARLNCISFYGLAPVKEEEVLRLPLLPLNWIKISLPAMRPRPSEVATVKLLILPSSAEPVDFADSAQAVELEILEDMGAIAADTFKNRVSSIYVKSILRAIAKSISTIVLQQQSMEKSQQDSGTGLMLGVFSVFSQLYAEFSEQADIRGSHFFPSTAAVAGVSLDEGVYSFLLQYLDKNSNILYTHSFSNVKLEKGKLHLFESFYLR